MLIHTKYLLSLFQAHFGDKMRVNKIQSTDCQRFKSFAKIAHLRLGRLFVANIASREAENEQIV